MLTVVSDSGDLESSGVASMLGSSSLIDEILREGARRMLAEALRAEVDAYCARFVDENRCRSPVSGSLRLSFTRGAVTCTAPAAVVTSRGS